MFGNAGTIPVYLLFQDGAAGSWTSAQESAVISATQTLLAGPYFQGLYQVGVGQLYSGGFLDSNYYGHTHYQLPAQFSVNDVETAINDIYPGTNDHSLYLVLTPPGFRSAEYPNAPSFQAYQPVGLSGWSFGWLGTDGNLDHTTLHLSQLIVNMLTNVNTRGVAYGNGEAANYSYRVNGQLLQSYWSPPNGAFIVPTGTTQNLVVSTIYDTAGNSVLSQLTIKGDQLGANSSDTIHLATSSSGGLQVNLNNEQFQFAPGEFFGGGAFAGVYVYPGGGSNSVYVASLPANASVDVVGSGGSDFVDVGSDSLTTHGTLANLNAPVSVENHGGSSILLADDSADTSYRSASLTQDTLNGLSPNKAGTVSAGPGVAAFTIYAGSGGDRFTISNVNEPAFTTQLFTGATTLYSNSVQVLANSGPVEIQGQDASNEVTVGTGSVDLSGDAAVPGDLLGIAADVRVFSAGGLTTVNVNDSLDRTARHVSIAGGKVSGLAANATIYAGAGVTQLNVLGGSGGNSFDVENPGAFPTAINAGSGNDSVLVGSTTNLVGIDTGFDGGGGSDTVTLGTGTLTALQGNINVAERFRKAKLTVNNGLDTIAHPKISLSTGQLTGLAPATITWSPTQLSELDILDGSGLDSYTINNPGSFPTSITTHNDNDRATVLGNTGRIVFNGRTLAQAVTRFRVSAPDKVTAGAPFQVTVTALDANGNVDKTYAGTIGFEASYNMGALTDYGAALPPDYTFSAADSGSHTFTVSVTRAGTQGTESLYVFSTDILADGTANVSVNPLPPFASDPGRMSRDAFGDALAISGSTILVGAPGVNHGAGAAYLYNTSGQLLHTFQDPTGMANDAFGWAVALSGSNVLIGADGVHHNVGAAYLYNTSGQLLRTFQEPADQNPQQGDTFGSSVALSGNNVLVGAGLGGKGRAFLFNLLSSQKPQIFPGSSVALSGDTMLVGGPDAGVSLYSTTTYKLTATFPDPDATGMDDFGGSVALADGNVLVGADSFSLGVGAAYLYHTSGGQLFQNFLSPNVNIGGHFGTSVALSGSYVLLGSDSGAYLYSTSGQLLQSFVNPSGGSGDLFGSTVAVTGSNVLVGANGFNSSAGAVYLYQNHTLALGSLTPTQATMNQAYNGTLMVSGGTGNYSGLHVTGLPAGLNAKLSGSTITINGTPTRSGTFSNIQVSLQDNNGDRGTATYSLTINPATANTLTVTGFPNAIVAGTAGTLTVTVRDAHGNIATNYTGTIHFSSTDAQAGLPNAYTFTAADQGVHTFSGVTLRTAGHSTITATDSAAGSITGTSGSITVNPAAVSTLVLGGFPKSIVAGTAGTLTVTARDAYGNIVTSYHGTVHVHITDSQAVPPSDSALTDGTGTFTVTLNTTGSQTITVTDTAASSLTGSLTVAVTAAQSNTTTSVEEAFVIGLDNQVYAQRLDSNGHPVGGYALVAPGQVKSLSASHDASGHVELFVIGLDDQVYALPFDASGNPSGGYFLTAPGQVKALSAGATAKGNPELFVIGLDNQVWALQFGVSGTPTGNYFLTAPGQVKELSVGTIANGNPELFVIGLDDQVYALRFDANGAPSGSYFLAAPGQVKALSAGTTANGSPELFVIGLDDQVWALQGDASGNPVGSYFLTAPGHVKTLSASHTATGNPEVFVLGLDDQVWAELFDPNGNLTGGYSFVQAGQAKACTSSFAGGRTVHVSAAG